MPFQTEPTYYIKGALSDLQGAWNCLRDAVVNLPPSEIQHKLIFHIDEGMSWESVRDLKQMEKAILLISNIIQQSEVSAEVHEWIEDLRESFGKVMSSIKKGEKL
jgi:hypothetical protein